MNFEKKKLINSVFNNKPTPIVSKSDKRNIKKQVIKTKLLEIQKKMHLYLNKIDFIFLFIFNLSN